MPARFNAAGFGKQEEKPSFLLGFTFGNVWTPLCSLSA